MTKNTDNAQNIAFRRWLIVGWGVIILVFGVGGAWAIFTRISGAVIAPAQVSPESGVRTVQHPDGGVITKILVREGDVVKKGQVLIVLQDEVLRAELGIVKNRLNNVLVEIARLQSERDELENILLPVDIEKKATKDPQIHELLKTQQALFISRRRALKGEQKYFEQSILAHKKAIAGIQAKLKAVQKQSELIKEELATVASLLAKGQATRPRLLALEREAARLEGEHGSLLEEIARRKAEIARFTQQLVQLRRNFQAQVLEDLVKRKEEATTLQEKLAALEQKLARVEVRAPISGHVFNMTVRTIGGVIAPGKPILQIVPNDEPLIIEARVRPLDIDEVHPGQDAWLYFSAFGARTIPKLKGRVRMVSPALVITSEKEAPYYLVKIEALPKELKKLGKGRHLVPGMPVEVFITTKARRPFDILIADVLLPPIRRALRSD